MQPEGGKVGSVHEKCSMGMERFYGVGESVRELGTKDEKSRNMSVYSGLLFICTERLSENVKFL